MKKYLGFVTVIALMSIMTACSQKTNVQPQQHAVSSVTNQKALSLAGSSNKPDNTTIQQQNGKKKSDEYIGHWYTSIPDTGGNSTTIEITKMSNTSVSFHLYYCRTYSYDGTNIKLENNIAKFVDNDDDYKTNGTIEFGNKSIIVNIEKTNLPILETGKTTFNYKVGKFNAVSTTPANGATDVAFGKGIVIDFGRKIINTTNDVGAVLTKPNVPEGPNDGSIVLDGEIEGNKLILSPSSFGDWKSKIEAGQKYDLVIYEGELRDETGNINNKINLEFTAKK